MATRILQSFKSSDNQEQANLMKPEQELKWVHQFRKIVKAMQVMEISKNVEPYFTRDLTPLSSILKIIFVSIKALILL